MKKKNFKVLEEEFRDVAIGAASRMNDMHFNKYPCNFLFVSGAMMGKTYNEDNVVKACEHASPQFRERIKRDIEFLVSNKLDL